MADKKADQTTAPTFSAATVSVLYLALLQANRTLRPEHFDLMSEFEGTRSSSAFEHEFRAIKTRANELHKKVIKDGGIKANPVPPKRKRAPTATKLQSTPTSKTSGKRGRKSKADVEEEDTDKDEDSEDEEEEEEQSSKRAKTTRDNSD